jgi:hypothetical protein
MPAEPQAIQRARGREVSRFLSPRPQGCDLWLPEGVWKLKWGPTVTVIMQRSTLILETDSEIGRTASRAAVHDSESPTPPFWQLPVLLDCTKPRSRQREGKPSSITHTYYRGQ